jgi:hypothetical protein
MDEEKADVSTVQQRLLYRSRTVTRSRELSQNDKTYLFSNTFHCVCDVLSCEISWNGDFRSTMKSFDLCDQIASLKPKIYDL